MNINPGLIFDTLNAFQRTEALRGAIELDLFTAIGEGTIDSSALSKKLGATERGVRVLADHLTIGGFLRKEGNRYRLTPESRAFLDRRSPAYLGGTVEFLSSATMREAFRDVASTVKEGKTQLPDDGTVSTENPVWLQFARAMGPLMRMPAQSIAEHAPYPADQPLRVLDVAAGHGEFGFAFAERSPHWKVYALDWKPVLEYTKTKAAERKLEAQMEYVAGSAFEVELPKDLDLILIPNFLHHFNPDDCVTFLKRCREALREGGDICIVEFVPNEDRVSPPGPAHFALVMLCSTAEGDAYTFSDLRGMLSEAGLRDISLMRPEDGMESLVWAKR